MAYITQGDLETRFGAEEILQLSDRDADGSQDTGVVEAAIADAESVADSYLVERVTVPVASPSNDLIKIVCDLARRYLHSNVLPDVVKDNYNAAMKRLKAFADGRGNIDGIEETGGDLAIVKTGRTRVFTEDALSDY